MSGLLAPLLLGPGPLSVEGLWQEMYQQVLLQGRAGTVMRAISTLDTAIWDRNARAASLPLYKFLGAVHAESVPAYASGGYYVAGKTPASTWPRKWPATSSRLQGGEDEDRQG